MEAAEYFWESLDFKGDALGLLDLFGEEPNLFFLGGSRCDSHQGRYSFIGFDPFDMVSYKGGDSLDSFEKKFKQYTRPGYQGFSSSFSPFVSGAVGCLSYDYGLYQEKIVPQSDDVLGLADCVFGFYDCIITIDHKRNKLYVSSSGLPEKDERLRKLKAEQCLGDILARIKESLNETTVNRKENVCLLSQGSLEFSGNFGKDQYLKAVKKALAHIAQGDIYQVNLSQRFQMDLGESPDCLALYRLLCRLSPAPFDGYFDGGNFKLMSNSPERFLSLSGDAVQTCPMKGTRPRGEDHGKDQKLREEILGSAKEKAELLMITDLMRNDLGRVCDYGSIIVREMRSLEEYNYVFQTTSTVEGRLGMGKDCFDLIRACFPGGSITGCPKIRSMEIIQELEPTRRSMYTGSLGYINFDGNMDFNILIRTLVASHHKLYFQVGSGIVADSIPEEEYKETLVKAQAMKACLENVFATSGV